MRTNRKSLSGSSLRYNLIHKYVSLQLDSFRFGTLYGCRRAHFPELRNYRSRFWNFEKLVKKLPQQFVSRRSSRGILCRSHAASRDRHNRSFIEKSWISNSRKYKFRTSEFRNPINNKCHNISSPSNSKSS